MNLLAIRFMVGLIVKPELPEKDVDLSDDKYINRYYYYICNGVDTIHTVSIEGVFVEAILDLVPASLRDKFPEFTNNLILEIKEDFTKNIKRAIVEFALTDSAKERPLEVGHRIINKIIINIKINSEVKHNILSTRF